MYKAQAKLLIDQKGSFVLSEGRAEILKHIHETGSIAETARLMNMSYRHIWGVLRKIETRAGGKVVQSVRGGPAGGRTRLTKNGLKLLRFYEDSRAWLDRAARYGPRPELTVDGIVLTGKKVLLIQRGREPFKGAWALPGGFVEYGEILEDAVVREVLEETGLKTRVVKLLGVYSNPDRDPRHHTVSAVYILKRTGGEMKAADDAKNVRLFPLNKIPVMAFDHADILEDLLGSKD